MLRRCIYCGDLIPTGSRCQRGTVHRPAGRAWRRTREQVFDLFGRTFVYCDEPPPT